jgi:hypothetical protein
MIRYCPSAGQSEHLEMAVPQAIAISAIGAHICRNNAGGNSIQRLHVDATGNAVREA